MNQMKANEMKMLADAIMLLHKHFGGHEWTINVGQTSYFDPSDFKPYRPITVNGNPCGRFDIEVVTDKAALENAGSNPKQ